MRLEYSFRLIDLFYLSAARLLSSWLFSFGLSLVSMLLAIMVTQEMLWLAIIIFMLLFGFTLVLAAASMALVLNSKRSFLDSRSLRIEDQGLVESRGASETLLEWKSVRKIRGGIGVVTIYYGARGRTLMFPARVFRTRHEFTVFYHTVMQSAYTARV